MIRELWFAIPKYLEQHIEHIPERAGIYIVDPQRDYPYATVLRKPKININAKKLTEEQIKKVLYLGCMRIFRLTDKFNKSNEENKELRKELKKLKN